MLKNKFNKPSLFIIILPYIIISWSNIYKTGFFSYSKLVILFFVVLILDLLFYRITIINNYFLRFFSILFVNIFILFFYGVIFFPSMSNNLNILLGINIFSVKWFFVFSFILIFTLLTKVPKVYKFINIFSLILFFLVFCNKILDKNKILNNINRLKNNPTEIVVQNIIQKPIILLITDEYASPDEIFKVVKNNSVYSYSAELNKMGFSTKNNFYSYETSTIHSISSLFNYNLSRKKDYNNNEIVNIATYKLLENDLYDSIKSKKCKIINFGIFDFGNMKPYTQLYNYPTSFLHQFLLNSSFFLFKFRVDGLTSKKINKISYLSEEHNKFIFRKTSDTIKVNKTFLYAHLFMPHSPFVYNSEFNYKTNTTNNYISYWQFTNKKLLVLLKNLIKKNKYRIIISGDHGYRLDRRINPYYTFAAFYGFDKNDVNKINSVQDIGSLINNYF